MVCDRGGREGGEGEVRGGGRGEEGEGRGEGGGGGEKRNYWCVVESQRPPPTIRRCVKVSAGYIRRTMELGAMEHVTLPE